MAIKLVKTGLDTPLSGLLDHLLRKCLVASKNSRLRIFYSDAADFAVENLVQESRLCPPVSAVSPTVAKPIGGEL
jgi:hypothetical protein